MKKLLALSLFAVLMMGVMAGCAPAAEEEAGETPPAGAEAPEPTETAEPE